MATDAVYIRMLDPFLHVYKTFARSSLEYLSCTYGCFTWGGLTYIPLLRFDQNCVITASLQPPTFLCSKKFNRTASFITNHSLMSLWGTHTDFVFIFFFMCIKLLDRDEELFATLKWWIGWTCSVLLSVCFYCNRSRFISVCILCLSTTQAMW